MLSQQCARSADRPQVRPTSLDSERMGVALHRPLGKERDRRGRGRVTGMVGVVRHGADTSVVACTAEVMHISLLHPVRHSHQGEDTRG
jgi:hypothetical protein